MNLDKQAVAKPSANYPSAAVASSHLPSHPTSSPPSSTSSLPNGVSTKSNSNSAHSAPNGPISSCNGNSNGINSRRPIGNIPVPTKFQLSFPDSFERALAPLDDAAVRVVQRRTSGLIHVFVMSLTFFSAIEFSLTAPATLYSLGYDKAGGLSFSVLWVLCIISQIPKKFIFRKRPWMSGRALPIRQDRTSSFPSRAVVCAVVFSWLIGQSLFIENILTYDLPALQLWAGIIFVAALTAFARINVGAHYASDTIVGFFLGIFVINLGSNIEKYWQVSGCVLSDAYAVSQEDIISHDTSWLGSIGNIDSAAYMRFFFSTGLAYGLTLISIQGFWVKCSYVYGLLLSSATFRACFLCVNGSPNMKAVLLHLENHGTFQTHLRAILLFLTFLIFGMATRGNKGKFRYIVFTLIYFGTFTCIMLWRLP